MQRLKNLLVAGVSAPGVAALLQRLTRDCATIFMLHRFAAPELGVTGYDPETLRADLEYLRRHRYPLLSLGDVFRRLTEGGSPLGRAVAFTIDDGYLDQAEIAAPVFAEFDCPVTTFVCTGFLDRELWMWWDKVEYAFRRTSRRELSVRLGGTEHAYRWADDTERRRAESDFIASCKQVPDAERHAAIARLAAEAEVTLPADAPPEYAPMSWDELRSCEERGMSFAPHTVTHPILSRTSDKQARHEIERSRDRLQAESKRPEPIFCYPNGQLGDFGTREFRILDELGFHGAVVGYPGYASADSWDSDRFGRFNVRRFSYPGNLPDLVQCVAGIERLKSILRREE